MPIGRKTPTREKIPQGFAVWMREVTALIEERDPLVLTESDDLIQCERGYGGLYDVAGGRYGFQYLVNDYDADGFAITWDFDLDEQQIRDVAAGKLTHVDMWRCESRDCGRRFLRIDSYCEECDFPP